MSGVLTWFNGAKLWLVGAASAAAFLAILILRAFSAGKASAVADAAVKGLERAIKANEEAKAAQRRPVSERANDPNNRDTWR